MLASPSVRPAAVLAAFWILASIAVAAQGPKDVDKKAPSFPIAAEAKAFVDRYDRTELVKDAVFIKVLEELARSKLSPEAKADAFALMQERIGWLFVGAARVFPGHGYAQTIAMILTTYVQYQEKMPAGLDVGPLLALSRTARDNHPLHASNALLLATILNYKAAKEAVDKAIDAKAIEKAPVPAIDLHNLCLAAALTRNAEVVRKVVDLLPDVNSEESREDVIAITGIFGDEKMREKLEQFVRRHFPKLFDNSIQTALIVLAHAGPPDRFRAFYKSLGDLTTDKKDIKVLSDFWDTGFRDRLQSDEASKSPLKIWDGFTVTLGDGGATITQGETFRYWISFR
jgi:hypothetical protein